MDSHGSASFSYTTYTSFGELLKVLRRRAELTQHELGAAVGYSDSYITRLERNERQPDIATVRARFIAALHLTGEPELAGRLIELATQAECETHPKQALPTPSISRATNLPAPLKHFIGRAHEIAEVERLLCTTRLLTLTGSGGVGKTRLAIETGIHLTTTFAYADGVWLVELASLADASPLTQTVAAAFGLQTMNRSALVVLTDYLADKEALVILDNCEHLIDTCAALAEALLQACPHLRILATSREGLNIGGEVIWCVPPMVQDEAVQLFAERAAAVKPGFVVTTANRALVEHICRRLDDMPLAIELAAARVRAFTLEQLAARMDNAFHLLTSGSRTALPRQQTLRATIDWSYNLLPEMERALLRGLSVFAGGWTLEAAEAILSASLLTHDGASVETQGIASLQASLVNKSLLVVEEDETTGSVRYRMLETIRQYASEVAQHTGTDELNSIRQRHLEYYAQFAQAGRMNLSDGVWHWVWDASVAVELDNTRAALNWAALCGDWQLAWRLMNGVLGIWTVLGHGFELIGWMDRIVIANPAVSDVMRADALTVLGRLNYTKGDVPASIARYSAASQLAHHLGNEQLILDADQYLGFLSPDYEQAISMLNHVIQLAHQSGRKSRESLALSLLGYRLRIQGDLHEAFIALSESVKLAREIGHPGAIAGALGPMGRLLLDQGDYAQARTVLEESVTLNRQTGLRGWLGYDLENLAEVGLRLEDSAIVKRALNETIPYYLRIDDLERVARGLTAAASLARMQGRLVTAARLLGTASTYQLGHQTHGIFERDMLAEYNRLVPALRVELAPSAFESAWADGQSLSLNEAIQEALAV